MKKLLLFLFALSLVGCASKEDVLYFQDIDDTQFAELDSLIPTPRIETNDILDIRISALDPESVVPFKFEKPNDRTYRPATNLDMKRLEGYLVDKNGAITFPQLGDIYVKGKTTEQVEDKLKDKLSTYITNPTVSVKIINYKFSILGEVKKPGTFSLNEQAVTLPQALGKAGDLTIQGERHDVLIIRNQNGRRIYRHIDLTKSDWMNSPFYYLKQNDIVYVQPNNPGVKKAGYIGSVGSILSIVSILLSTATLIFK